MRDIMLWVNLVGLIAIPIAGWVFKQVVMDKLDELEKSGKDIIKTFGNRLDEEREDVQKTYLRLDVYAERHQNLIDKSDAKFNLLIETFTLRTKAIEDKLSAFIERYDRHQKINQEHIDMLRNANK